MSAIERAAEVMGRQWEDYDREDPSMDPDWDREMAKRLADEGLLVTDDIDQLRHYAGLLAWIMASPDDRFDVQETAMHVWRVELTKDQHEQLQQYLPADLRDGDDQ